MVFVRGERMGEGCSEEVFPAGEASEVKLLGGDEMVGNVGWVHLGNGCECFGRQSRSTGEKAGPFRVEALCVVRVEVWRWMGS